MSNFFRHVRDRLKVNWSAPFLRGFRGKAIIRLLVIMVVGHLLLSMLQPKLWMSEFWANAYLKLKANSHLDLKTNPHLGLRAEPHLDLKTNPHLDLKAEPHLHLKTNPHLDLRAEPHLDLKTNPHLDLKAEPHLDLKTNPHLDLKTNPHLDLKTNLQLETTRNQACLMPKLDPYDPDVIAFDTRVAPIRCSTEENWVFVENGTFRIAESVIKRGKSVSCKHTPIYFGNDDFSVTRGNMTSDWLNGSLLVSDAFEVDCSDGQGRKYNNVHQGITYKASLHSRAKESPLPSTSMGGYDIAMFGFDSVSRMSWMRNLPKTREFFTRELGGIELEGHNILGDGTVMAMTTLLTGQSEWEVPEARKEFPGAVNVDVYPWIWNDYKKAGYVTAWGEDVASIGTYQMRFKGFKNPPVDHYARPYHLAAEPKYGKFPSYCTGSVPRHVGFFNYYRDVFRMYGYKRKMMLGFHGELSHSDNSLLKNVDEDFSKFLRGLNSSGYLNRTILILMADHGPRFAVHRKTQQGKLEERLPYFGLYFPPSFEKAYPKEVEQVRKNRQRLTTNYDVHETFGDLLDNTPTRPSRTKGRGISLFKPVPENRTCEQAGIAPHWCACLSWEDVSHDDELKSRVAKAVVDHINNLTEKIRDRCELVSLHKVISLSRFVPRQELLKFLKSDGLHGDHPNFSDRMKQSHEYIQVVLITNPGQGRYEVTVKQSMQTGNVTIRSEDMSRTNKYGKAAACVETSFPSLRQFCYCKQ